MITGKHIRAARAVLGLGVRDLAAKAGVSFKTVHRFEQGHAARSDTLLRMQTALETEGIEFLNTGHPGIRWRD